MAQDRVAELAKLIKHHKDAYYNGQPEISDAAFDQLEDELRALAPDHAILKTIGAAPRAGAAVNEWPKARHAIPMGSLNKAVNADELREWAARCDKLGGEQDLKPISTALLVTEKLDGLSLAVNYEDGELKQAITRGDGHVGEDITPNARRMQGVPAKLKEKISVSIRGEIILKLSDVKKGFPGYVATPRNKAAGTSKRFDGEGCQWLSVFFYDLEGEEFATEDEKYARIRKLGLIVPDWKVTDIAGALEIYAEYIAGKRANLDYEIDGLVVRANDLRAQTLLGELGDRPRAAVAFKFPSLAKNSKVIAIAWDTGPSGRVTPIAQVEPVDIGGAIVQNVSLHNASNVERLGVGVGDEVLVSRRNDVIPYLEEVVVKHGTVATPPERCTTCHSELTRRGEYLQCTNRECFAIVTGRLKRWVGVQDIHEWGDKLVVQLVEAKLVKEPADLYVLSVDQIANLERRGEISAKKIHANLHAALPLTLPIFLASLGMDDFAFETAKLLVANGYDTLDKLLAAKLEDIEGLKGMGSIKAKNVIAGLEARRDEIGRLLAAGIVPVPPKEGGGLYHRTFCFTGTLPRPRKDYEDMVDQHGGQVLSGVTKDLDFLVMSDPNSASTKAEKAKKYGTSCISPDEFLSLVARAEAGETIASPRPAEVKAEPAPKKKKAATDAEGDAAAEPAPKKKAAKKKSADA